MPSESKPIRHSFQYDNEGNLVRRTNLFTGEITDYTWDRRNRLASVARRSATGTLLVQVDFTYDPFDRRIAKTVDPDGAGPQGATSELFVYDGIHIALVFKDPDGSGPQASSLKSRHLFGPAVDQVLAEEQIQPNGSAKNYWLFADHLGSIRRNRPADCVRVFGTAGGGGRPGTPRQPCRGREAMVPVSDCYGEPNGRVNQWMPLPVSSSGAARGDRGRWRGSTGAGAGCLPGTRSGRGRSACTRRSG